MFNMLRDGAKKNYKSPMGIKRITIWQSDVSSNQLGYWETRENLRYI